MTVISTENNDKPEQYQPSPTTDRSAPGACEKNNEDKTPDEQDNTKCPPNKDHDKKDKAKTAAKVPTKLNLAPHVTKSEPNTPVFATTALPEEAPDEWFATICSREYIAIMTMEHIPQILHDMSLNHSNVSESNSCSPRLMPLLDRMKFYFSRSMAMARWEAEHGVFDWNGVPGRKASPKMPIEKDDCMSGLHVESFLAGIEEIRLLDKDKRVIYRRYWRIMAPPPNFKLTLGGVTGSGSVASHHLPLRADRHCWEHWHTLPKLLLAEFTVDEKGLSIAGRMLKKFQDEEDEERNRSI